ncbi:MAG: glycoside hydrolase family 99-like domain-containing protein [Spirochaetia bacterium]|nr:glycoside hydrolase family 99-like domain-containing protein [Spirochaetia bacterium]
MEFVAGDAKPVLASTELTFSPAPVLTPGVIPEPVPAKSQTLNLMHYCALWKTGTHEGWGKIEPWPERRPVLGWYDEGTPEVADWHVKQALEHGIQGFIYCWYRKGMDPVIQQSLGHALDEGLLKSRFVNRFQFALMWENLGAAGVKDADDLVNNLLLFWISNYFKHDSYVKVDNKPVLFVYIPGKLSRDLGDASEKVKAVFERMREACRREGFSGLTLIGCVPTLDENRIRRMALEGWDATTAYGTYGAGTKPPGRDAEGIAIKEYGDALSGQVAIWKGKKDLGLLPDLVDVTVGWDPRPWFGTKTAWYLGPPSPKHFQELCVKAKALVDATPGNGLDKKIVVFNSWNEFGEGHFIEPTAGYGFGFLEAIQNVFCAGSPSRGKAGPRDAGFALPEKIYLKSKESMNALLPSPESPFGVSWVPGNVKMSRLSSDTLRVPGTWAPLAGLPTFLQGAAYVCPERGNPKEPAPSYPLTLNRPVRVYLLVHNRGTPKIPEGWIKTEIKTSWSTFSDTVYQKELAPGTIEIPGHDGQDNGSYGVPNGCVIFSSKN